MVSKATETKKWYQSKTVWSCIVAIAVAILQNLIQYGIGDVSVLQQIMNLIIAVAGVFGIYGRVTADKKIE